MKIQFVNQLDMQWVKGFKKAFEDCENQWVGDLKNQRNMHTDGFCPDVRVFMWLYPEVAQFINKSNGGAKNVVYIRRFEYYTDLIERTDWSKVAAVIMVNDFLADGFEQRTGVKPHVVYNAIDPDDWTYRDREPGLNIAWVGFVNKKKNLPLALQIMDQLPRDYILHVAGGFQDTESMDYTCYMAQQLNVKVNFYGQIPSEHMDAWLEDKDYLLNTSISEGCPNSVLEATAKGIKPVVHNWPGAENQFMIFNSVPSAIRQITTDEYDSELYRKFVTNSFGPSNYAKVRKIIEGVL